ncbi:MAG TPA: adenosine deaminase [Acidimicrobiales bacterium]|nr:adenosine deaminase [Acidimicrobiales bacterium]
MALPKAEVHVHLEGSFTALAMADLASAAGVALPRPLDDLFTFANLAEFLELLDWSCSLVRTTEQVTAVAYGLAAWEHQSGVGYADVIVNPTHWPAWNGRLSEFLAALDAGFTQAEEDGLTSTGLCVSLLRQQSAEEAAALVEYLVQEGPERVVALSIDGNEAAAGRTSHRFAQVFSSAAAAGLHRTVHAGESSGPEGVWDAIDLLGAERIDHGVRAIEDPRLVETLARRHIPLGICPTSNVMLGISPSYAEHPLERLRRAGVAVSVNTDDPALLGTRLEWEYARIGEAAGWGEADYISAARTSIEAAFCSESMRSSLLTSLQSFSSINPEVSL